MTEGATTGRRRRKNSCSVFQFKKPQPCCWFAVTTSSRQRFRIARRTKASLCFQAAEQRNNDEDHFAITRHFKIKTHLSLPLWPEWPLAVWFPLAFQYISMQPRRGWPHRRSRSCRCTRSASQKRKRQGTSIRTARMLKPESPGVPRHGPPRTWPRTLPAFALPMIWVRARP